MIYSALTTTDALSDVFSDTSVVQAMLDVEVALARVQARLGIIPSAAADAIAAAASADRFDARALACDARESGTLAIPLAAALTAQVRSVDPKGAGFVHWGATSQDIVDTAFVRLVARACEVLGSDHAALVASLRALSDRHANDAMLGRTLLQPAAPITFGLKAAGWCAGVSRSWARLDRARRESLVLQFGGAVGTLASLDDRGLAVAEALAAELELECPDASWHAYGDRLAALVSACGIYTGILGKIARDISLLMQPEIGEVAELGGGSSTLPQKRNPSGCAIVLAAATRMPGLVSAVLTGLVQEHERSAGAWHAQWPTVVDAIQATGSAVAAMRGVVAGLTVDTSRMRANIDATQGAVFAERDMMRLASSVGRDVAHETVRRALAQAPASGRVADDPASYLGVAEALRRRLLASSEE